MTLTLASSLARFHIAAWRSLKNSRYIAGDIWGPVCMPRSSPKRMMSITDRQRQGTAQGSPDGARYADRGPRRRPLQITFGVGTPFRGREPASSQHSWLALLHGGRVTRSERCASAAMQARNPWLNLNKTLEIAGIQSFLHLQHFPVDLLRRHGQDVGVRIAFRPQEVNNGQHDSGELQQGRRVDAEASAGDAAALDDAMVAVRDSGV